MRKVVHFEIPAADLDRAQRFYGSIFGWSIQRVPLEGREYFAVTTTPVDEQTQEPRESGGINGGLVQRAEPLATPVITIDVGAIDVTLREIETNGGTTLTPRTPIAGMGAYAYFRDPEGNVLGLWETSP
jgi:predicted enzyme related to lactoylglutathione lyase